LTKEEKLAIPFQRLSHVVALLAHDFIKYLTSNNYFDKLKNKIKLLSREMFEKNHQHRSTTLQNLANKLDCQ